MLLVCPKCKANYEIPRHAVPIGGREVKCADCGHSWFQTRTKKSNDDKLIEPQTEINLMEPILLAKNALELRANELGKEIIIEQKFDIAPMIKADADQIIEVFHNLIDNAIKYSIENSTIKIILDVIDDINPKQMSVTVENIGMGIGEEHLPRLTERFYRVDKARSRNVGGTGLGLAIVKHILLRHSADLEVSSQVNGKTRFTVLLPIYS